MELICTDRKGNRRVNNTEAIALIYTFGVEVGSFLIDTIKVEYNPALLNEAAAGRAISKTEILLQPNYDAVSLFWLGIFIHEAAHIWQRNTGRHREGEPGEDYEYGYKQLLSLNLKIEEHAEAVQDWFYVKYGLEYCMVGPDANQLTFGELQDYIRPVMGVRPDVEFTESYLRRFVDIYYVRVIEEIRDPSLLEPTSLGQTFPNPAA